MTDIVQIQNPKSHMWTLIDRDTGTILEHSEDNTPYKGIKILGECKQMSHNNTRIEFYYSCIENGHFKPKDGLNCASVCSVCGSMVKANVSKVKRLDW